MTFSPTFYIAVFLLIVIGVLGYGTSFYHGRYEAETALNAILQSKNTELIANIDATNKAIEQIKKDGDLRAASAAKAQEMAGRTADSLYKQAQTILALSPVGGVSACSASDHLLDSYLKSRTKVIK